MKSALCDVTTSTAISPIPGKCWFVPLRPPRGRHFFLSLSRCGRSIISFSRTLKRSVTFSSEAGIRSEKWCHVWANNIAFKSWKNEADASVVVVSNVSTVSTGSAYLRTQTNCMIVRVWKRENDICTAKRCTILLVRLLNDANNRPS